MKFKKTVLTILCVVLCLSAFGCGSKSSGGDKNDSAQQTEQTDGNTAKDEKSNDGNKKDNSSSDDKSSDNGGTSADKHPLLSRARSLKAWLMNSIIPMTPKRKKN